MEARSERKDGVLVFFVNGRLDAFGAQQLDSWAREELNDDDKELVVDMTDTPYLSSGGIRVFNGLQKELKRRSGKFVLSAVGEYPKKVLEMAGFSTVFPMYATTEEAVEDLNKKRRNPSLFNEIFYKKIIEDGVSLTIEPGWMTKSPAIRVTGDLDKVLHATITESDIRMKKFSEVTYSLGLGALGADAKDALPLLGEMITLYGSMVWLPTDGNSTPDFLTPGNTSGSDLPVYTGFNITLDGPFNEYLTLDTTNPKGVSISDIYKVIFSSARDRIKTYRGVVAVTMWGVLSGFASSGLKKAPVAGSGLKKGESIMAPSRAHEWMASDSGTSYQGDTLVSFGIGIDLGTDLSGFNPENLDSLYYANPLNTGAGKGMYLHNHGVVFRNIPYDPTLDLNTQVKKIVTDGEFVDMRHLLDSTRLRKAKIGIAYIQDIQREP
ncbi:MAG: STAS domain-containing protein [Methanoregula sp.]|jgi:anti-anti-sigma factor|uniref:STAS domain-containing protein n=1 Tax=Methanoregula sp. TaxID=2052170 RepID=UPI0025CCCD52|nr:STAS domain-containing protein [Methanoregula sp.]MCK9631250.1 STAS domain-containing protein [Methanoregula sp.]